MKVIHIFISLFSLVFIICTLSMSHASSNFASMKGLGTKSTNNGFQNNPKNRNRRKKSESLSLAFSNESGKQSSDSNTQNIKPNNTFKNHNQRRTVHHKKVKGTNDPTKKVPPPHLTANSGKQGTTNQSRKGAPKRQSTSESQLEDIESIQSLNAVSWQFSHDVPPKPNLKSVAKKETPQVPVQEPLGNPQNLKLRAGHEVDIYNHREEPPNAYPDLDEVFDAQTSRKAPTKFSKQIEPNKNPVEELNTARTKLLNKKAKLGGKNTGLTYNNIFLSTDRKFLLFQLKDPKK